MCLLRPLIPGALADAVPAETPPPALEVDDSPAYQVQALLDSRHHGGHMWTGSRAGSHHILDPNLIWELYLTHPAHSSPQGPSRRPAEFHGWSRNLNTGNHSISPVNYSISLAVSLLIIQSVCLCFRSLFTSPVFTFSPRTHFSLCKVSHPDSAHSPVLLLLLCSVCSCYEPVCNHKDSLSHPAIGSLSQQGYTYNRKNYLKTLRAEQIF